MAHPNGQSYRPNGYEPDRVPWRWLLGFIAGLGVIGVGAFFGVHFYMQSLAAPDDTQTPSQVVNPPAEAWRHVDNWSEPRDTYADYLKEQDAFLNDDSGHIDVSGFGRIPIDDAMQVLAKQRVDDVYTDERQP